MFVRRVACGRVEELRFSLQAFVYGGTLERKTEKSRSTEGETDAVVEQPHNSGI